MLYMGNLIVCQWSQHQKTRVCNFDFLGYGGGGGAPWSPYFLCKKEG